jgi:hypothetical protein
MKSFFACSLLLLTLNGCDADVAGGGDAATGGDQSPPKKDRDAPDRSQVDAPAPDAERFDVGAKNDSDNADSTTADGIAWRDAGVPDLSSDGGNRPARDFTIAPDLAAPDLAAPDLAALDLAVPDLHSPDLHSPDLHSPDLHSPDLHSPDLHSPDLHSPDLHSPDLLGPDLLAIDLAPDGPPNLTGLTVPCANGPGWTMFRFRYGGGNKSARVDVWDASCNYSFAPNSACNVREVYPGFGSVSYTSSGYPIFTTSQYLRVRFSAAGLRFSKATVYVQARSYATSSSTRFRVWSPLYGDQRSGLVDNDWVYDWYAVDWTGYLYPSDKPSLTAIQIYASSGSGKLAVKAVELCVQ